MTLLTQAEYARRCGVSRQAVGQWKGDGRLVLQSSQVDVEASDAALKHYRHNAMSTPLTHAGPVKRGHPNANATAQIDTEPMQQLPCAEVMRRLQALDWRRTFDWTPDRQHERATLAARCVGWYAVTSELRDSGHWGGFQLRTEVMADGELNSNCITGGFGFEFDCWDVLRACRRALVESFDGDEDVSVRADLLHWLAHPFAEHDKRR